MSEVHLHYPIIDAGASDESVKHSQWCFPAVFDLNQNGNELMWQVGFDGKNLVTTYGTYTNSKGEIGKFQVSSKEVELNSRSKSLTSQALQEARHELLKKTRMGYRLPGHDAKTFMCQLAKEFVPTGTYDMVKDKILASNIKKGEYPVFVDVKVDGARALVEETLPGEVKLMSRSNREMETPLHNLKKQLSTVMQFLPKNCMMDGELYIHGIEFQDLMSIVRTEHEDPDKDFDSITYMWFDISIGEMDTISRKDLMKSAYKNAEESGEDISKIILVEGAYAKNEEEIEAMLQQSIDAGYEGIMIRKTHTGSDVSWKKSLYTGGRNNNLLKYKRFKDEEGIVVEINEAKGRDNGTAVLLLELEDGTRFKCRPTGTHEFRTEVYENRDDYIGMPYTFKYQEKSKTGVPRFPVGIAFRPNME